MTKIRHSSNTVMNRIAFTRGFVDGFSAITRIYRPGEMTFTRRFAPSSDADRKNVGNDFAKVIRRIDGRREKVG